LWVEGRVIFDNPRPGHAFEEPSCLSIDGRDQAFHVQESYWRLELEEVRNQKPGPSVAGFGKGDDEGVVRISH